MNTQLTLRKLAFAVMLFATANIQLSVAHAQGTAFTYQGRLSSDGSPVNGSYDLMFTLFSTNTAGTAVAGPVTNTGVAVSNGLFTTVLNFGPATVISGSNWLELAVNTNGANSFTTLVPRQQLTPTPYAIFAEGANAAGLTGTIASSNIASGTITSNLLAPGAVGAGQLAANIGVWSQAGNNVFYNAGIVGIGTNAPADVLHAVGSLGAGQRIRIENTGNGYAGFLSKNSLSEWFAGVGLIGNGSWELDENGPASGFRLVINTNGNVGLGTPFPGENLTMATSSGTSNDTVKLALAPSGGRKYVLQSVTGNGGASPAGAFQLVDASVSQTYLTALAGGNIGMGTISPLTRLHVDIGNGGGFSYPAAIFEVENCGNLCGQPAWTEAARLWNQNINGRVGLSFMVGGSGALPAVPSVYLGTGDSVKSNDFRIATQTGGALTDRVYINGANGNVGIGTTAPNSPLQVNGNIQMGSGGASYAASGQENLRIVRGVVSPTGTILHGSGFTVVLNSTGNYTITFTPGFSDSPSITLSGASCIATWHSISPSQVGVSVVTYGGTPVDQDFTFIAAGSP